MPVIVRYVQFCFELDYVVAGLNCVNKDPELWVCDAISHYHHPRPNQALRSVTAGLLPYDVCATVAEYFADEELLVHELTIVQCDAMKDE